MRDMYKRIEFEKELKKFYDKYWDEKEDDGTDFAHPSWWRGERYGIEGACQIVEDVLKGKDNGIGVIGNSRLEKIRRWALSTVKKF
jgi:hypothetical protein